VASIKEIQTALECGVEPHKMIYANPCKSVKYIEFAKDAGVNLMVVDCICEMEKIRDYYPEAAVLVRIKGDDSHSLCKFNSKYGLDMDEIDGIFRRALELKTRIKGVSFHIGSFCKNKNVFLDAIQKSRRVFEIGKLYGYDMNILDIGGGFLGDIHNTLFDETADVINGAICANFPSNEIDNMQFIAEPGRYFSSASHTLVTSVISIKSKVDNETGETTMIYYINDGIYGIFSGTVFDYAKYSIEIEDHDVGILRNDRENTLYNSIVFGPTCDSVDIIDKGCMLPLLRLGDRLIIRNIGAYSIASATEFNGFPIPEKYYISLKNSPSK